MLFEPEKQSVLRNGFLASSPGAAQIGAMTDNIRSSGQTGPVDGFDHVNTWVFDLDNTLYPVTEALLAHIDEHMGNFVANFLNVDAEEAHRIQKAYFRKYGLTLRGLMIHHGLDPVRYYDEMTPMDLSEVTPNPALGEAIGRLPGRKIIYTNASVHHAEMVLDHMGIRQVFEAIYDISAADYLPKPAIESYRALCDLHRIDPSKAVMVDDISRNLAPAAELGMTTVWLKTGAEWSLESEIDAHIHHVAGDIMDWVEGVATAQRPPIKANVPGS